METHCRGKFGEHLLKFAACIAYLIIMKQFWYSGPQATLLLTIISKYTDLKQSSNTVVTKVIFSQVLIAGADATNSGMKAVIQEYLKASDYRIKNSVSQKQQSLN